MLWTADEKIQLFAFVFLQTFVKEFVEFRDVFVIASRCIERPCLVVQKHIEWLCIGTELAALQITPLVTDGAQGALLPVFDNLYRRCERLFVVHIKRNEHVIFLQLVGNSRVGPYGG